MIIPSQSEFEASVQLVKAQAPPPALCHIVHNSKELINVLDAGCQKLWEAKTQKDIEIILMMFLITGMLICDSFQVNKYGWPEKTEKLSEERNKEK